MKKISSLLCLFIHTFAANALNDKYVYRDGTDTSTKKYDLHHGNYWDQTILTQGRR